MVEKSVTPIKNNKDNKHNNHNKLDIVYTYVNNTDKKWFNKISKYTEKELDHARYNFFGEIYFSLLSVQKFFKWVHNIYIIHDNQPFHLNFLDIEFRKKVKFIDHKQIIPHKYLPLFNSEVIECFIWNIRNLSEYFIYLNDDIFFGNYIYYSDFFAKDNMMKVFYFNRYNYYPKNVLKKEPYLISTNSAELLFNKKFSTNYHIKFLHISFNLNKYICKYTFHIFYDYLSKNFTSKFRKYDNLESHNSINKMSNFSFLHLCAMMMIYKKIAIPTTKISYLIIQQLDNEKYEELFKKRPKIFNINQLYERQLTLWNKLQKIYF